MLYLTVESGCFGDFLGQPLWVWDKRGLAWIIVRSLGALHCPTTLLRLLHPQSLSPCLSLLAGYFKDFSNTVFPAPFSILSLAMNPIFLNTWLSV